MTYLALWMNAPEKVGRRLPGFVKVALIPWFVVSLAFAIIPDLRTNIPRPVGLAIALPVVLGLLWMAIGMVAKMCDRLTALFQRYKPRR